jgi:hypothetical protein
MKTTTNPIYPTLALFAFACLALSPQPRAACEDACDLLNHNTAHGDFALANNTNGLLNTANGLLGAHFKHKRR